MYKSITNCYHAKENQLYKQSHEEIQATLKLLLTLQLNILGIKVITYIVLPFLRCEMAHFQGWGVTNAITP